MVKMVEWRVLINWYKIFWKIKNFLCQCQEIPTKQIKIQIKIKAQKNSK